MAKSYEKPRRENFYFENFQIALAQSDQVLNELYAIKLRKIKCKNGEKKDKV